MGHHNSILRLLLVITAAVSAAAVSATAVLGKLEKIDLQSSAALNWSSALQVCTSAGMSLPSVQSFNSSQSEGADIPANAFLWLNARCSWKDVQGQELHLQEKFDTSKLQIVDTTGTKNCLCLQTRQSSNTAKLGNCDCETRLPYTWPNVWEKQKTQSYDSLTAYEHSHWFLFSKYSYYSTSLYSWSEALVTAHNAGYPSYAAYTDVSKITSRVKSKVHLPADREYWIGLGNYSCSTDDGLYVSTIKRDNDLKHGDCYSFNRDKYKAKSCSAEVKVDFVLCESDTQSGSTSPPTKSTPTSLPTKSTTTSPPIMSKTNPPSTKSEPNSLPTKSATDSPTTKSETDMATSIQSHESTTQKRTTTTSAPLTTHMHHHEHNNPDVNASNRFANDAVQETTTPNGSNGSTVALAASVSVAVAVIIVAAVAFIILFRRKKKRPLEAKAHSNPAYSDDATADNHHFSPWTDHNNHPATHQQHVVVNGDEYPVLNKEQAEPARLAGYQTDCSYESRTSGETANGMSQNGANELYAEVDRRPPFVINDNMEMGTRKAVTHGETTLPSDEDEEDYVVYVNTENQTEGDNPWSSLSDSNEVEMVVNEIYTETSMQHDTHDDGVALNPRPESAVVHRHSAVSAHAESRMDHDSSGRCNYVNCSGDRIDTGNLSGGQTEVTSVTGDGQTCQQEVEMIENEIYSG